MLALTQSLLPVCACAPFPSAPPSFLDLQSLCRAAQVSRGWRHSCLHPVLWRRLAEQAVFRLAPATEQAQLAEHALL